MVQKAKALTIIKFTKKHYQSQIMNSLAFILGFALLISSLNAQTYSLVNRKSALVVGQSGTSVDQEFSSGAADQVLTFTPVGSYYQIQNGNGYYLTAPNGIPASVLSWSLSSLGNQQLWQEVPSYANYNRYRNVFNGLYMQVQQGKISAGAPLTQYYGNASPGWERQQFAKITL